MPFSAVVILVAFLTQVGWNSSQSQRKQWLIHLEKQRVISNSSMLTCRMYVNQTTFN